jgi:3-deoxy-D-manno-octulosonic acid kinase
VAASASGFRRLRRGRTVLVVDPRFEAAALGLGLLEPGALARWLREAPGPGGRAPTALLPLPDQARCLLRPVRHGGLLGPWLGAALLGMRRPLAELRATAALRAAGAPVPAAVLALGERAAGPVYRAAVATVFEEKAEDGAHFLARAHRPEDVWAAAAAAGRAVRRFHDAGGRHADLNLRNLLLRSTPDGFDALVIDLDKARVGAPPDPARRMAELMRLYRSARKLGLLDRLGPRGLARFFAAYTEEDRSLRSALRARLPRELRRLRWHRSPNAG